MPSLQVAFFLFLGVLLTVFLAALIRLMQGPSKVRNTGVYVGEVWLDWFFGRGSTLYRQRFQSRWGAYLFVKAHAILLDWVLPTHYRDTDWSGRPTWHRHEYGIRYGVRRVTPVEAVDGVQSIWSPVLPGTRGSTGEHASAHPFERNPDVIELPGDISGFKL